MKARYTWKFTIVDNEGKKIKDVIVEGESFLDAIANAVWMFPKANFAVSAQGKTFYRTAGTK